MSLRSTRCTDAIALAQRVLRHAGVRTPEEIDIELIAFDYGICSIPKRLPGHAGNLVRVGDEGRALVAVDEASFGTPRGSFTLGHELGHKLMHPGRALAVACFETERDAQHYREEREADVFAVELTLPEFPIRTPIEAGEATLAFLRALAARFRASLTATALRFVDFSTLACALALSKGGRIVRHAETEAFPLRLVNGFRLGSEAFASSEATLGIHESGGVPGRVRGDPWSPGRRAGGVEVMEHSVLLGPSGTVLSLLTA